MHLTVNGVDLGNPTSIDIKITTEQSGERMPPVSVEVNGGTLSCHRSDLTTSGPISLHMFGEDGSTKGEKS